MSSNIQGNKCVCANDTVLHNFCLYSGGFFIPCNALCLFIKNSVILRKHCKYFGTSYPKYSSKIYVHTYRLS